MTNNTEEIKNRIKRASFDWNSPQKLEKTNKKSQISKNQSTIILGICIAILSLFTFYSMLMKGNKLNTIKKPVITNIEMIKVDDVKSNQVNDSKNIIDKKLEEMNNRITVWTHRIWLLGVANNENISLQKNIIESQGIEDPGFIVFDTNWKMNRVPKTMPLNEEHRRIISGN